MPGCKFLIQKYNMKRKKKKKKLCIKHNLTFAAVLRVQVHLKSQYINNSK